MGTHIPKEGIRPRSGTADALFTQTQQRVLALLFGQPERRFTISELIALAASGSGAVQREVARLVDSALVVVTSDRRSRLYQANANATIFEELRRLVEKTLGVAPVLRAAIEPLTDKVRVAILFGSLAKGTDRASSDVDVLIVSDELTLEEAYTILAPIERKLARKINPTIYTMKEFALRRRNQNHFVTKILAGPHEVLIGKLDESSQAG